MGEDEQLYLEFLNGNQNSFEIIVKKYSKKIIYFIYQFVNNIEVAKDLSQDVFVYILSKKPNIKAKYSLKSYLFMISRCRALNYLKREKNKILEFDEKYLCQDDLLGEIEDIVFRNIEQKNIINLLMRLKAEYGKAVYLADIEGLSYKEISRILGKSVIQVTNYIFRGRKKLRELLEKEEENYV